MMMAIIIIIIVIIYKRDLFQLIVQFIPCTNYSNMFQLTSSRSPHKTLAELKCITMSKIKVKCTF